jgi:hypothetical protein
MKAEDERGNEMNANTMTSLSQMTTEELGSALSRSQARETYLEANGYPTTSQHATTATIRMLLSERLGVTV